MVDHDIQLNGLLGNGRGPTILQRTDPDFISAILGELPLGLDAEDPSVLNGPGATPPYTLFQPVHRTFYVALVDASRDSFGSFGAPRVDPSKIEGAGLVIRRIAALPGETPGKKRGETLGKTPRREVLEGWREWREGKTAIKSWDPFLNGDEENRDPDPAFRRPDASAGHPEINRLLTRLRDRGPEKTEAFTPLFSAPPEVISATGKTILYGVIPAADTAPSQGFPPEAAGKSGGYTTNDADLILSDFLEGGVGPAPWNGKWLSGADVNAVNLKRYRRLASFMEMLYTISVSFDAFGDSKEAKALFRELNRIELSFPDEPGPCIPLAGDFLKEATRILQTRQGMDTAAPPAVFMPICWPSISGKRCRRLKNCMAQSMNARFAALHSGETRFATPDRLHRARAFIRVRREEACPPATIWSDYSERFRIAAWYECGDAPPARIPLPDATDRGFLEKLKPNVAFIAPNAVKNLLDFDPEALLEGKGKAEGGGVERSWMFGFNIPVITLCAFVVLSIFLHLLHLVFWWLPNVKICIPLPRKESQ
ncbi:MAG: hypothetical protein GY859_30635 [Desulfobacterales bacterium]|nr:hypothetical protein [Desulfobacterales bacterium]